MAARSRRRPRRHALSAHQRRSRAARKAARTRARRYGRRHYASRKRRAIGADFGINPRRKYRHVRNPRRFGGGSLAGFGSMRGITKLATGAGVGMVGAVGLDYLWQWGSGYLPAQFQTGYMGTLAKAAAAVLAGWGASKLVGRPTAIVATGGALTVIGYQLLHQLIATNAPSVAIAATTTAATPVAGLRAYMPDARRMGALAWTSPGSTLRGLGRTGAYMQPGRPMAPAMNRPGGSVSMSGLAMPGSY